MPKITRHAGPSYDPLGPFTGNPHDDRPEVVTPAEIEPDDAQVVSPDVTVTSSEIEADVPARADQIEPWVDKATDRTDRARRIGAALQVERARAQGPRSTVLARLDTLQRELRSP